MSLQIAYLPDPMRDEPWRLMIPAASPPAGMFPPGINPPGTYLLLLSSHASYLGAVAAREQANATNLRITDLLLGDGVH